MASPSRAPVPDRVLPSGRDPLPVLRDGPGFAVHRPEPTTLSCLRCQLLGRRRMLCSRADTCREVPMFLPLGPLLLLGWLVTAIAFVLAVR